MFFTVMIENEHFKNIYNRKNYKTKSPCLGQSQVHKKSGGGCLRQGLLPRFTFEFLGKIDLQVSHMPTWELATSLTESSLHGRHRED